MSLTDTIPRPDMKSPLSEIVRRNIRGAIVRAGYTQADFASRVLRKNTSWLSRRLRKQSAADVTLDDLQMIATALSITPEELLRR